MTMIPDTVEQRQLPDATPYTFSRSFDYVQQDRVTPVGFATNCTTLHYLPTNRPDSVSQRQHEKEDEQRWQRDLLKWMLLFFNAALIIFAVYLLIVGGWIRSTGGQYENVLGGDAQLCKICGILCLALAAVAIPLACIGVLATLKRIKFLIFVYLITTFCLLIIAGTLGILGFILRGNVSSLADVQKKMGSTMLDQYGLVGSVTEAWDRLQEGHACCAVNAQLSHSSYPSTNWYARQTDIPRSAVPLSCCATCSTLFTEHCSKGDEATNMCTAYNTMCSSGVNRHSSTDLCVGTRTAPAHWPVEAYRNIRTCDTFVQDILLNTATVINGSGLCFAVILLFTFLAALVMYRKCD